MLKLILLETPGVVESEECIVSNISWYALTEDAKLNGTGTILLAAGTEIDALCREKSCRPQECLLLAADRKRLCEAEQIRMPAVAFGDNVPGFLTKYHILTAEGAGFSYLRQVHQRLLGEPVVIAETERLLIREMTEADAETLWSIQNHDEVRKYVEGISDDREIEIEKHKAYVRHAYSLYGYGLWGIYLKDNMKLIGRCGIQDYEAEGSWEVELGYLLEPAQKGCGYATEAVKAVIKYAFQCLDIPYISAWISPENERSIRLAKRVGMQLRTYGNRNGKLINKYVICNHKDSNNEAE